MVSALSEKLKDLCEIRKGELKELKRLSAQAFGCPGASLSTGMDMLIEQAKKLRELCRAIDTLRGLCGDFGDDTPILGAGDDAPGAPKAG